MVDHNKRVSRLELHFKESLLKLEDLMEAATRVRCRRPVSKKVINHLSSCTSAPPVSVKDGVLALIDSGDSFLFSVKHRSKDSCVLNFSVALNPWPLSIIASRVALEQRNDEGKA